MKRERKSLPVERWPSVDQRLWTDGFHAAGLFETGGAGAHWSRATRRNATLGYGRWLGWLQYSGELDAETAPGQRITQERVNAYLTKLAATGSPYTMLARINELRLALRVLAPGGDWPWLASLHARLRSGAAPVRDKRRRLRPVGELVGLGQRLMREAEAAPAWSPLRRAVHYRDGLMILLLVYRPVRLRNFASIRLGRHLVVRDDRYGLVFGGEETKTRQPYEAALPEALTEPLRHYLEHHRRVLLGPDRKGARSVIDALWVAEIGTALEMGALSARIRKHTRLAYGATIPPHWFRDAAATSIAIEDPAHVRDAHHVLGHARLETTEHYYNQARSLQASRRYGALIARLGQHAEALSLQPQVAAEEG